MFDRLSDVTMVCLRSGREWPCIRGSVQITGDYNPDVQHTIIFREPTAGETFEYLLEEVVGFRYAL